MPVRIALHFYDAADPFFDKLWRHTKILMCVELLCVLLHECFKAGAAFRILCVKLHISQSVHFASSFLK